MLQPFANPRTCTNSASRKVSVTGSRSSTPDAQHLGRLIEIGTWRSVGRMLLSFR
jgi:hypothetical protein